MGRDHGVVAAQVSHSASGEHLEIGLRKVVPNTQDRIPGRICERVGKEVAQVQTCGMSSLPKAMPALNRTPGIKLLNLNKSDTHQSQHLLDRLRPCRSNLRRDNDRGFDQGHGRHHRFLRLIEMPEQGITRGLLANHGDDG